MARMIPLQNEMNDEVSERRALDLVCLNSDKASNSLPHKRCHQETVSHQ